MTKNTMTQVQALSLAIASLSLDECRDDAVIAKLTEMKEALEKKRSTPSKADIEKQNEIAGIMTCISDTLTNVGKPMTISEMQATNSELANYTNQKLSAVLRKMVDNGTVVRTVEKKKTYFSLA